MTFRCMKGLAPTYLCESLRRRKSIHYHNTRNRESLDIPPSKTKSGQRRFLHRAVNIWNNLDKDFKQLSLPSFKKKLQTHMLENYFNYWPLFIILFVFYYNVLYCLVLKSPLGNTNKSMYVCILARGIIVNYSLIFIIPRVKITNANQAGIFQGWIKQRDGA